jgi:hypothetical protein
MTVSLIGEQPIPNLLPLRGWLSPGDAERLAQTVCESLGRGDG